MSESVLQKFGKYFLLDRIGEGGMAEIFRARLASMDAQGRLLVIKRIQGAFSDNPEFLAMFRSEVQVSMRFAHPNVVQLYEAGEENGQQFIAMELVDGRNLRQVLSRISQNQLRFPIPAACFVVEQTAAGLHYAHAFKDRITGEALNLVHRDVSPQNIILSYDGNIKVIDFGIAKATTNSEATRAGVIKGKLSYLSPEQVMGEVLDSRSDIFALGIVFWEMLTGRRLFVAEGENEFQVLKMIESCTTFVKPPSTFNPEVPKELDQIVMQALSRDPKKRFQTAEDMARVLRKLLAVQYSDFGPSDLSIFIKKMFQDQIVEDRKRLQQVNARAEELIKLGTQNESNVKPPVVLPDQTRVTGFGGNKFEKSQITNADRLEMAVQPQRQMKIPALRTAANPGEKRREKSTARAHPFPVPTVESNDASKGKLMIVAVLIAVAGYIGYQKFMVESVSQVSSADTQQSVTAEKALSHSGRQVGLRVRLFPDGNVSRTRVTVNSQLYDLERGVLEVPMGEPLEIIVDRPGFVTYRKEFTIRKDQISNNEWSLDVKLEPMEYGTISISTRPAVADVRIINLDQGTRGLAQEPVILKTPVYQEKLPAGHYKIAIQNDVLGVERTFQMDIKEGQEAVFPDVQLESK